MLASTAHPAKMESSAHLVDEPTPEVLTFQALDALINAPLKIDEQDTEPTDAFKTQPKDPASALLLNSRTCPACPHAPFLRVDHLKHHIL